MKGSTAAPTAVEAERTAEIEWKWRREVERGLKGCCTRRWHTVIILLPAVVAQQCELKLKSSLKGILVIEQCYICSNFQLDIFVLWPKAQTHVANLENILDGLFFFPFFFFYKNL